MARVSGLALGTSVIKHLRITVSVLLAVAALLSPLSAWALGLGQINVISQRDQPLLAEIPIISTDTSELEALHARLASPETFARIGLSPPQGIVSDLQFSVALDARGRPVIRVTSAVPVQQSLLTFLVEVDWGKGRLVREYSALLETPQTAAAPAQPPIQEATVDPGNAVVRLPDPPPAPANPLEAATPTAVPLPPTPTGQQTASAPSDVLSSPVPMPIPLPAEPDEVATAAPIEVVAGGDTRAVRAGETLGGIAAGLGRGHSLDQTILALLRANPEAFIDGNANRLKAGAVLRIPDDASIAQYTPDEAAVVVREQAAQWRGTGRALPQPPAVVGAPTSDPVPVATAATPRPPRAARPTAQARLEIVPPSASDARRAGTRSGVSAGGEGEMLRQQELQQTKETLVARDAEVQELKARVAELEQLKQQQDQLVALKDSELAAAQQRLATTQAADAGTPVNFGPWLGVGAGLLVIGLLAGWWLRRRQAVADGIGLDRQRVAPAMPESADADLEAQGAFAEDEIPPQPEPLPVEPAWNRLAKPVEPEIETPAPPTRGVPTWHSGDFEVGPLNPAPPGQGRLDLACAYLEMGDRDTARSLLQEVATRGDNIDVRRQAEQLLRELG
ncbi:MAG: ferrous iron transporter B [Lysobacter sp.]|nr:ferrous iron transporter B [Lysobacter sp.]